MIKLLSSDLNGTLVHQQTMSHMVRLYRSEIAASHDLSSLFEKKAEGSANAAEALAIAGPSTRGVTLRQAIEYTKTHMTFVDGFQEFVDTLHSNGIHLVINSTAYSVTIYAIREQVGRDKIHGHMENFLRFGEDADPNATLREDELESLVTRYFRLPGHSDSPVYDKIKATGRVELNIGDEVAKTMLLIQYAQRHFPGLSPSQIAHMGDTMGDSTCIYRIARFGGLGIAFNYNSALENFVTKSLASEEFRGRMVLVDPKGRSSNLMHVVPYLLK